MADFFRVQNHETCQVIEMMLPELVDPMEFDRINDEVLAVLNGAANLHWIVDLSGVTYMGSAMLGLMVNIRQRVKTAGGRLVLCGMSNRLLDIFRACSMERLFTIARTRGDAIRLTGGK